MARHVRIAPGGFVYHVLNRSAGKFKMFRSRADFDAFHRVMIEAHEIHPLRILSYCVMSNHWHFVVWPREDGEVTSFFRWLTLTHAIRWRKSHNTVGYGHLYQGRFKSFPIEQDPNFLTLNRYVERNPLTAGLVERAEHWQWGSLYVRENGPEALRSILTPWPVERRPDWIRHVNSTLTQKDIDAVQLSLRRGRPFGTDAWVDKTIAKLGLQHTVRAVGRPWPKTDRK